MSEGLLWGRDGIELERRRELTNQAYRESLRQQVNEAEQRRSLERRSRVDDADRASPADDLTASNMRAPAPLPGMNRSPAPVRASSPQALGGRTSAAAVAGSGAASRYPRRDDDYVPPPEESPDTPRALRASGLGRDATDLYYRQARAAEAAAATAGNRATALHARTESLLHMFEQRLESMQLENRTLRSELETSMSSVRTLSQKVYDMDAQRAQERERVFALSERLSQLEVQRSSAPLGADLSASPAQQQQQQLLMLRQLREREDEARAARLQEQQTSAVVFQELDDLKRRVSDVAATQADMQSALHTRVGSLEASVREGARDAERAVGSGLQRVHAEMQSRIKDLETELGSLRSQMESGSDTLQRTSTEAFGGFSERMQSLDRQLRARIAETEAKIMDLLPRTTEETARRVALEEFEKLVAQHRFVDAKRAEVDTQRQKMLHDFSQELGERDSLLNQQRIVNWLLVFEKGIAQEHSDRLQAETLLRSALDSRHQQARDDIAAVHREMKRLRDALEASQSQFRSAQTQLASRTKERKLEEVMRAEIKTRMVSDRNVSERLTTLEAATLKLRAMITSRAPLPGLSSAQETPRTQAAIATAVPAAPPPPPLPETTAPLPALARPAPVEPAPAPVSSTDASRASTASIAHDEETLGLFRDIASTLQTTDAKFTKAIAEIAANLDAMRDDHETRLEQQSYALDDMQNELEGLSDFRIDVECERTLNRVIVAIEQAYLHRDLEQQTRAQQHMNAELHRLALHSRADELSESTTDFDESTAAPSAAALASTQASARSGRSGRSGAAAAASSARSPPAAATARSGAAASTTSPRASGPATARSGAAVSTTSPRASGPATARSGAAASTTSPRASGPATARSGAAAATNASSPRRSGQTTTRSGAAAAASPRSATVTASDDAVPPVPTVSVEASMASGTDWEESRRDDPLDPDDDDDEEQEYADDEAD